MRVLVVSGIWPPDVGGPASHAPELAAFLLGRGHEVEVVTTAAAAPAAEAYPVRWASRRLPVGARHLAAAGLVGRRAARCDVVYSTGMLGRSAVGCALARRPFVVKLTQDPAFERALRRGRFRGDPVQFQSSRAAPLLRAARDAELRRAAHVICPSAFLAGLVRGWGVPADRISVLPNPVPPVAALPPRAASGRPLLAFAGRLTAPKDLAVALEAVARVPEVELVLAGDGDERAALEARAHALGLDGRVRFLGSLPREDVLALFRRADAVLLSSRWENFPHTLVEGLAVGTPAIATAVGGVPEIVADGENGLLVAPGDPEALATAVRRFLADEELRKRLAAAAASSAERFSAERVYGELEAILLRAAAR
ncbi:MAG TPA: glycosyltransferase family 4 protein [Gaiellaceae bacterium]|nr:glycosyltransferase family 4 protein [Gaiellaceae bacterium]